MSCFAFVLWGEPPDPHTARQGRSSSRALHLDTPKPPLLPGCCVFVGGVPCLFCVFLLRSLALLLLRLGWLALRLSAAVLLGTHSLGGCWLFSSLLVLLHLVSLLLVLALCLVAFSRLVRHGWRCVGAALGGVCLFRCCLVAFGLLLIGVTVFGWLSS